LLRKTRRLNPLLISGFGFCFAKQGGQILCSHEWSHFFSEKTRRIIMKKTYKIEVDCANCANKMEEAAKKTAGVKDAVVNFMTLKMNVEFEDGADVKAVMQDVLKNCKKVEDDCEIYI